MAHHATDTSAKRLDELTVKLEAKIAAAGGGSGSLHDKHDSQGAADTKLGDKNAQLIDTLSYRLCEALQNKAIEGTKYGEMTALLVKVAGGALIADGERVNDVAKTLLASQDAQAKLVDQLVKVATLLTAKQVDKQALSAETQKLADAGQVVKDTSKDAGDALIKAIEPKPGPSQPTSEAKPKT